MRFAKLTPIVAILALAACDNAGDTTAEAPAVQDDTAIVQQDTTTGTPVVEDDVAVVDPQGTAPAGGAPAGGEQTAQTTTLEPNAGTTGETDVTVITPEGQSQTTAQAPSALGETEATGALGGAATAEMVEPGTYVSDQLSLELADEGTFVLTGAGGGEVTGDWRIFGDTLTLSNAEGATGDATFPMTCTIAEEGQGFRVSAGTSSCEMLDGQIFQPQG